MIIGTGINRIITSDHKEYDDSNDINSEGVMIFTLIMIDLIISIMQIISEVGDNAYEDNYQIQCKQLSDITSSLIVAQFTGVSESSEQDERTESD